MLTLRPPQQTGKLLLYESLEQYNATICVAPTGFGKTVLFSDIAREAIESGVTVMIMVDRKELLSQAEEKLNENGLYPVVIDPNYQRHIESNLYLASVETLRNRKYPDIGLLIIDECHKRTFDEFVLHFKNLGIKCAGFTATPVRSGKSKIEAYPHYTGQLIDVYEHLFIAATITEQLEGKYLVPCLFACVPLDISDISVTNTAEGLEYNQKQVFAKFDTPVMYAGCVENYLKFSKGKKCICFNANVAHSKKQRDEFIAAGIHCEHLDADTTSKERKNILKRFKNGLIDVLCNVAILTTGYDEPTVECIIINKVTMSLALWLQMIGRGGRQCAAINKTNFIAIDQGSNYLKHAYWDTERDYQLDYRKISTRVGVAPAILCEQCESFIPASSKICPFCQAIQLQKEKEKAESQLVAGEFAFIDTKKNPKKTVSQMSVSELENYRVEKKFAHGWIVRQLFARGEAALHEYSMLKNYAANWVDQKLAMAVKEKETAQSQLWEFMQINPHLTNEQLRDFSVKKLKQSFSIAEIDEMMPEIFEAFKNCHTT